MASESINGNDHAPMQEKRRQQDEDELKFGWGNFCPKGAQILTKPIAFLVLAMIFTIPQVMLSEMLPTVMFTLKMRFTLSEKEENALTIVRGVSAMVAVIVVGYLGGFRNKIRWISAGMVLTGIGAIFFSMPHFMIEKYEPLNVPEIAMRMFGLCMMPSAPCSTESVEKAQMFFFVAGQIFIGAGVAPLYCLVPAYIDENVNPRHMPIYITVWFCNILLAPVWGMVGAGFFAQFYIDLKQPDLLFKIEQDDLRWRSAWWLGYLIFGILVLIFSAVFVGFPERLPGSRAILVKHMQDGNLPRNDPKLKRQPSGIIYATISLLKNRAYLFNTLALCCIVFYLSALGPFLLRVIMIKYGAHPLKVGMPFSIVLLLGSLGGIILGGFLLKRVGLKNIAKGAAFICLVAEAVCIITPLMFVIPGCNESRIAGVSVDYPPIGHVAMLKQKGTSELTATCNAHCKCSTVFIQPLCGSNNVAYFDPCHAGCIAPIPEKRYTNCSCIPPTKPGFMGGDATAGYCDRSCKSWAFFLVVMFIGLVIFGASSVPSKAVVLRCVPHNQRAYAFALQTFLYILMGFIPGYLTDYIMHQDCNIWQTDPCGRKGLCWDYKANSMSKSMTIFALLVTVLATVFYFLSWYQYAPPQITSGGGPNSGRLLSDTDVPDDEDGKETNL